MDILDQAREQIPSPSTFLLYSDLQALDDTQLILIWEDDLLYQSTYSKANLFQKHLHRHTQK